MIDITYKDLVEEIATSAILKTKEELLACSDLGEAETIFLSTEKVSDKEVFLEVAQQDILYGECNRLAKSHGLCEENGLYLSHEGAMFIIRNSDNIGLAMDGAYRKWDYKDTAGGCLHGDVILRFAEKIEMELDLDPFDNVR